MKRIREWWDHMVQQDSPSGRYNLLKPSLYIGLSVLIGTILFVFGGVIYAYSGSVKCVDVEYTCGDYAVTEVSLRIPEGFPTGRLVLYYGLTGFYSAYMGLKNSFSAIQLQAPRALANLPYSACEPVQRLSDLRNVVNPYVGIDAFATDPNWRDQFDLADVSTRVLRPCGALYYWVLTDTFELSRESGEGVTQVTSNLSWDTLEIPSESPDQELPYIDPTTGEFVWADPSGEIFRAWARSNVGAEFLIKAAEIPDGLSPGNYKVQVTRCRDLDAGKFVRICNTAWVGTNQVFLSGLFFACGSIIFAATIAFILMSYRRPL